MKLPAVESMLRRAIEARLEAEGIWWVRIRELRLDETDRRLHAKVELEGEAFPIEVSAGYRFSEEFVHLEKIETSKSWMTHAAAIGLARHGGRFPLPGGIMGRLLRSLL